MVEEKGKALEEMCRAEDPACSWADASALVLLAGGKALAMVMVSGDMGEVREIAGVWEMRGIGLVIEEAGGRGLLG